MTSTPPAAHLLALVVPLCLGLAAALASRAAPLRAATAATSAALALALAALAGAAAGQLDLVTGLVLTLVCGLGAVIARYSATYLEGDPGQRRHARALLGALACVTLIVVARDLRLIALAWFGASVAIYHLLTHFPERRQAQVAAHEKFLVSRLADVALVAGLALLGRAAGTFDLDALGAWARRAGVLPADAHVGVVLLVVSVALRSAQLPFHGWLTRVMEAPTPVSALLHAGVVNIGGFVLIRLAPVLAAAPAAQLLLVAVGTTTAVVAALVMSTRPSVKAALAWSTCAQMGFMLAQCGLGLWHLALLHLIAHSLYKAHAFLSSGSAVETWGALALLPRKEPPALSSTVAALALVAAPVAAVTVGAHALVGPGQRDPALLPLALLLCLALTPHVAPTLRRGGRVLAWVALRSAGAAALYVAWHEAFARLPGAPVGPTASPAAWALLVGSLALLLAAQATLEARPDGRLARALQPHLHAGLHLAGLFTRITFRLWPPRGRARAGAEA